MLCTELCMWHPSPATASPRKNSSIEAQCDCRQRQGLWRREFRLNEVIRMGLIRQEGCLYKRDIKRRQESSLSLQNGMRTLTRASHAGTLILDCQKQVSLVQASPSMVFCHGSLSWITEITRLFWKGNNFWCQETFSYWDMHILPKQSMPLSEIDGRCIATAYFLIMISAQSQSRSHWGNSLKSNQYPVCYLQVRAVKSLRDLMKKWLAF